MDLEIRPATPDEIDAVQQAMGYGFGFDPIPEFNPHFAAITELDRTRCVFDGASLVATSGAYSLDLTVPGGTLPAAGTTLVSVRGSHRRRGLLRAMMRAHIEDVRERKEPLAALWASESLIYGRFGYGLAAYLCSTEIETAHGAFRDRLDLPGSFRLLDSDEAREILPDIYDEARRQRPGHFARSSDWWEHRCLLDPEWERRGASRYRFVVYIEDHSARGYLQFRVLHGDGSSGLPADRLAVRELQALDARARAALWRYALDVDLIRSVQAWNQPVDDALPWLLADPRRLVQSVRDALWVRVVDLPRALEGRSYATEGRLVLEVHDDFCPWNDGTWELEAGPHGAKCRPSLESPDLSLTASDLGALYLGGNRFQTLARAGRIRGDGEVLRRADAMFTWDPLPWCPEIF